MGRPVDGEAKHKGECAGVVTFPACVEGLEKRLLLTGLPFGAYETFVPWKATDIVLDPARPILYAAVPTEKTIRVLDTETFAHLGDIPASLGPAGLAVSPDGSSLFGFHALQDVVSVFDLGSRSFVQTVQAPTRVTSLVVGHDGLLYLKGMETSAYRMDWITGAWSGFGGEWLAQSLGLHPTENILYRLEGMETVVAYDLSQDPLVAAPTPFRTVPAFSPDGKLAFAQMDETGTRYVVDTDTYERETDFPARAFSKDWSVLYGTGELSAALRQRLLAYELASDSLISGTYEVPRVNEMAVSSSGEHIFCTAADGVYVLSALSPDRTAFADAGISPVWGRIGDAVSLDASRSYGPAGAAISSYSWDLNGDGVFGDATGVKPTISWATFLSLGVRKPGMWGLRVQIDGPDFDPVISEPNQLVLDKAVAEMDAEDLPDFDYVPDFATQLTFAVQSVGITPSGVVTVFDSSDRPIRVKSLDASGSVKVWISLRDPGSYYLRAEYSRDSLYDVAFWHGAVTAKLRGEVKLESYPDRVEMRVETGYRAYSRGDVEFLVDGVSRGTVELSSEGSATLSLLDLPPGSYHVQARYSGDDITYPADATVEVQRSVIATETRITALAPGAALVEVSYEGGKPTGTVLLWAGDKLLGSTSSPNELIPIPQLDPGSYTLYAEYLGVPGKWHPSRSPTAVYEVNAPARLEAVPDRLTIEPGGQVTVYTRVTGVGLTTPTGTISVYQEGALLGRSEVVDGLANVTAMPFGSGDFDLRVQYSGDSLFDGRYEDISFRRAYTVDVLFVYGTGVSLENRNIHSNANSVLRNSLTNVEVRGLDSSTAEYATSGRLETDLDRLIDPDDGFVDEVYGWRDSYGADVVCLVVNSTDPEFIGMAMTPRSQQELRKTNTPFMVIDSKYASRAFAHEFAHIFGAQHDYDPGIQVIAPDAFGYSFVSGATRYKDVMSYAEGNEVPYYSNPDVSYVGVPLGVVGRANVARVISEGAPIVAGYRAKSEGADSAGPLVLSASPLRLEPGEAVTLTATGIESGPVEFYSGGLYLGWSMAENGVATFTSQVFGAGVQLLTAKANERYLSNTVVVAIPEVTLLPGGVLRVNGTPYADAISATVDGGQLSITIDGTTSQFALTEVQMLVVSSGDGDDVIDVRGVPLASRLESGAGDDQVVGTAGDDTIGTGDGNDTVYANFGDDLVDGGMDADLIYVQWGSDTAFGGGGADTIYGEDGADLLYGGDENDVISGGVGGDTLYGNFGGDSLLGGEGDDEILAGIGRDEVSGGAGDDTLRGGNGADLIRGGVGHDYIEGKGKADSLYGGDGNDTMHGLAGDDLVYGDDGDDEVYVFDGGVPVFSDTVYAGAGSDRVQFDAMDLVFEHELDLLA